MTRQAVLAQTVPPVDRRRREIESTRLPANLGALLDAAAAEKPDGIALHFIETGRTLTYRQLRDAVNRLAGGLRAVGIRKGTHVGVMVGNVPAFPITWLAIARLGAVMIPTNTRYTARELHYVLDDGEAEFLVIEAGLLPIYREVASTLPRIAPENVVAVDGRAGTHRSWSDLAEAPELAAPTEAVGHDDLLNIQYTSGTTGFPKGCMLTQLYWLTIGLVNARRDGRTFERILASTPFFYMDPQWLMLMAFYQRGTLFVAERQSASRFMGWVRDHEINFCFMPNVILKQPPSSLDRDHRLVKANAYGFSKHAHAELEERFDLVVREAFGMTEIGSALFTPMEAVETVGTGTCGTPVAFRECRIVDPEGADVPDGELGELVVRGPGILKGYYRKPEATAAAFHGEWFRTGDIFRRDASGYYYIVGRVKDMIRRAGENIAAREVEAIVCGLPEVAEAAALPVPDEVRGEEVKIYVVPQPHVQPGEISPERIVAHCEANLASFKVPRYIEFIAALPKTPSEKVAKHVLKAEKPDLRAGSWDRTERRWC